MTRAKWAVAGVAVVLAALGGLLLVRAETGLQTHQVTVRGVPLYEVRASSSAALSPAPAPSPVSALATVPVFSSVFALASAPALESAPASVSASVLALSPGVVVAHGFAGSARLMRPFSDSLARRGFVVVLLDFGGHGANLHRLDPESDVDTAVRHLRSLPGVDPSRISLVGHSMGAAAVTRYAAGHPDIAATVAISLPEEAQGAGDSADPLPARLLVLVGALELPEFHRATGSRVVTIPAADHVLILYAPRTHQEMLDWLGAPAGPPPMPFTRVLGAGLLLVAFGLGFYPLASVSFKPFLFGYAVGAVTIPIHLGVTHAIPSLPRLALMAVLIGVSAAYACGCMLLTGGAFWRSMAVYAMTLSAMTVGALVGVVPGFFLLIVPLVAVLLTWQASWTAILAREQAPPWLTATVASVLPAIPAALALPLPIL